MKRNWRQFWSDIFITLFGLFVLLGFVFLFELFLSAFHLPMLRMPFFLIGGFWVYWGINNAIKQSKIP